jgi:hypothetical protein
VEMTGLDFRLNNPFLFGFEFDRHRCTPFRPFGGTSHHGITSGELAQTLKANRLRQPALHSSATHHV